MKTSKEALPPVNEFDSRNRTSQEGRLAPASQQRGQAPLPDLFPLSSSYFVSSGSESPVSPTTFLIPPHRASNNDSLMHQNPGKSGSLIAL